MLQALGVRLLDADGADAPARRRRRWRGSTGWTSPGLDPRLAGRRAGRRLRRRQPADRPERCGRGVRAAEGRLARATWPCSTPRSTRYAAVLGAGPRGRPSPTCRAPAERAGRRPARRRARRAAWCRGPALVCDLVGLDAALAGAAPGRSPGRARSTSRRCTARRRRRCAAGARRPACPCLALAGVVRLPADAARRRPGSSRRTRPDRGRARRRPLPGRPGAAARRAGRPGVVAPAGR